MNLTFVLAAIGYGLCWGQAAEVCTPSALNIPEESTLVFIRIIGRCFASLRRTLKRCASGSGQGSI